MTTATPSQRIDMTGRVFGRWTVIDYAGKKRWLCRCVCGTERRILGASLRSGVSASCGCLRDENFHNRTHGMYLSPIYKIWTGMIQRCHNPKNDSYERYGAVGIVVCERWRNSFEAFLNDMGDRPSPRHSLDRYPNQKGNYEPGNVRWATPREQVLNRCNNRRFAVNGESLTISELAERYRISANTITKRLRLGWSVEDAVCQPIQKRGC